MPNYRRALVPGASWFFTVNLLQRRNNDLLVRHVDTLRAAVRRVHHLDPFTINAWVVLPEHMHCVWTLPPGDADYSLRWRLIKTFFCRALPADEYRSTVRLSRRGQDWPYSSFHRDVRAGLYPVDWAGNVEVSIRAD